MVGHSTGGGEVARYIGRHGTGRVAKAVLIGAVPPLMLKTPANPGGLPIKAFDDIRAGVAADRRSSSRISPRLLRRQPAGREGQPRRARRFLARHAGRSQTARLHQGFLRDGLHRGPREVDVPTLIIHGDDDQIVPIGAAAQLSSKLVKNATLKVYPGAPHRLADTHRGRSTPTCSPF